MEKNNSLNVIKAAIDQGRPATTDIVPGTVLHHFLYKSRANVQFTMSSYSPDFTSISRRRRSVSFNSLCLQVSHLPQIDVVIQQRPYQYPRQDHPCQGPPLRLAVGDFIRMGHSGL